MQTYVKLEIHNLAKAESAAKEILEHIEAIRDLQRSMSGFDHMSAGFKVEITDEK